MANLVREDRYIKSDVDKNNNKVWYIFEYDDASITTEFGRVGKNMQSRSKTFCSQDKASTFYDKKCKEKVRHGRNGEIAYRKLDVVADSTGVATKSSVKAVSQNNLADVAVKQIDTGDKQTDKLIRYFAKVNVHNIKSCTTMTYNDATGQFSTPCGMVTQGSLDDANDLLVEIGESVAKGNWDTKSIRSKTGDYLMLVPQEVGRKLDVRVLFPDLAAIQKQKAVLDSLQASLDNITSVPIDDGTKKPKVAEDKVFSVKLLPLNDKKGLDRINRKYQKTLHRNHACSHLKIKRVFTVEIDVMKKAFISGSKVGNVHEYWHGTRASNLLSILKGGLIIPPSNASNVTGRMFGNGLYFSSESTKSLNYSYGYWGGSSDDNCFMFLADVAMGKYHTPRSSGRGFPVAGTDSTWAKAGTCVANHEMIVYRTNQCNLKYLVEFSK